MGLAHPRFAVWAAQDGRVEDLVFHLRRSGKEALKPYANSPKKQTPLHFSAIRGHAQCVRVLCEAGTGCWWWWGDGTNICAVTCECDLTLVNQCTISQDQI